jgi:hypothetical protein
MFERATANALRASAMYARAYAAACELQAKLIENRINSQVDRSDAFGDVVVLADRRNRTE